MLPFFRHMPDRPKLIVNLNLRNQAFHIRVEMIFIGFIGLTVTKDQPLQPAQNRLAVEIQRHIDTNVILLPIRRLQLFLGTFRIIIQKRTIGQPGFINIARLFIFRNWPNIYVVMFRVVSSVKSIFPNFYLSTFPAICDQTFPAQIADTQRWEKYM